MLKYFGQKRGQIIGEYVITIAVLVGAMVTMTVYVRRALQARIHDTSMTMVEFSDNVSRNFGGGIGVQDEYEPYYGETVATTSRDLNEEVMIMPGGSGMFQKNFNQAVQSQTQSIQLPPSEAE